jgi:membrane protease YdiL (CAAX protease family)
LALLAFGSAARAQEADATPTVPGPTDDAETVSAPTPIPTPWPSDMRLPLLSVVVPGWGQFAQHAPGAGAAYAGAFATGLGAAVAEADSVLHGRPLEEYEFPILPRSTEEQVFMGGLQLTQSAGLLSAYDSFHRALPSFHRLKQYEFLTAHEPVGRLFTAPFTPRLLLKKNVWIPLAGVAALAAVEVTLERDDRDSSFVPLRGHDVLFGGQLSYQAGVTEEAFFRGYALPVLQQHMGKPRLANLTQALVFGALHISKDNPVPVLQTGLGFLNGAVTQKRGGSIREAVFLHFWWDVIAVAAELVTQKGAAKEMTIRLPAIRVSF